nr:immunoglobulin heavy chain junction region [Mus musculus]NSM05538.1 immunoglobulin heavy chain junction region [Mus musculus]NSM07024.1 immunoglobulin heavy chain junction region [Mus musculus]NSM07489.1 immunoglobulin heavy chain junction region [Mus musculus]
CARSGGAYYSNYDWFAYW